MKQQNRNILMFIDNCSCHHEVKLSNVKLLFFPQNTTSVLQPMDKGVIAYFKAYYRKGLVKKLISDFFDKRFSEATTLSLLSCVLLAKLAWNDIKSETIKNCFKKSGFNRVNQNEQGQEHEEREEHETANDHLQTYALLTNTEVGTFSEFVNADNSLTISNQLNLELINKYILNEIQQHNDEYDSETQN